nr:OsmC family protein [Mycobacterium sp. UM_NZ2]
MSTQHTYTVDVSWTGNHGTGTSDYRSYGREHEVGAQGCPPILGTADPAFRGDPTRWNPEQLLLAALSQCHMLSYLYLCSTNGVVVVSYQDRPVGTMIENTEGGHFTTVVLQPRIEVADAAMVERARALHSDAHRICFIASSVNFPVHHDPVVQALP